MTTSTTGPRDAGRPQGPQLDSGTWSITAGGSIEAYMYVSVSGGVTTERVAGTLALPLKGTDGPFTFTKLTTGGFSPAATPPTVDVQFVDWACEALSVSGPNTINWWKASFTPTTGTHTCPSD